MATEPVKNNINTVEKLAAKRKALEEEFQALTRERATLIEKLTGTDLRLNEVRAQHALIVELLPG